MKLLIFVNLIFAIGLGFLLAFKVQSNPVWLGFIFTWFAAEGFLARDANIKWWHWALLLAGLTVLDVGIVLIFGH